MSSTKLKMSQTLNRQVSISRRGDSPWAGFELTTLMVIGTDCIGSFNSNYHTITTTRAPVLLQYQTPLLCEMYNYMICVNILYFQWTGLMTQILWKERLNNDSHKFHQCQQNRTITSHLKSLKIKKTRTWHSASNHWR